MRIFLKSGLFRRKPQPRRGASILGAALGCLTLGCLTLACSEREPAVVENKPDPPRNLLILCLDTLRYDRLGVYGHDRDTSPHLDALAEAGTLMTTAYAHSNWTVPSTATLLTSVLPSEHGATVEGEVKHLGKVPVRRLRDDVSTLGEMLSERGFRTGLFSANPYLWGRYKNGFDAAEVGVTDATSLNDLAIEWLRGSEAPERPEGDPPVEAASTEDQAVEAEPFFLYLQYIDLHHPTNPPEPFFNYFPVDSPTERGPVHTEWSFENLQDPEDPEYLDYRDHRLALYDGAIRYLDQEIDRLLGTLEEMGVLEDTLVVITADHGEEFWDHLQVGQSLGGDPRDIYGVGHGHAMFEELVRVPLIFSGRVAATARRDCAVGLIDVAPTAFELLDLPPHPQMRGRSFASLVRGETQECPDQPIFIDASAYGPDTQAVVWRRHKLIRRPDALLVYDLRVDPDERRNLADESSDLVAGLTHLLEQQIAEAGPGAVSPPMELDEETRRQLRALGYL